VRYVLEGSVRKAAGRVRITGQLIEAATGAHLWADKFDGELQDVFELQDNVTMSVVGAIAHRLTLASMQYTKRKPPENWDSYDHNLRGMTFFMQRNTEGAKKALEEYRKAIDLDPTFGLAYGRAALSIFELRNVHLQPVTEEERAEALRMATRAVELSNDDEMALACASFVFSNLNDEFERGAALADRAVALNPNLSAAWNARGWMSLQIGEAERASDAFGRALRLNPLDPFLEPAALFGHAAACLLSDKYDEGITWANRLLAKHPTDLRGLVTFVGLTNFAGRISEAWDAAARIRTLYPTLRSSQLKMIFRVRKPEHQAKLAEMISQIGLPE
jgi:tetratricopeptide (TPR) repeat protein